MNRLGWHLLGGASVTAMVVTGMVSAASAGGFAVREQSTTTQGMSFAGAAAHESISSMFWNPAAVTLADEFTNESHYAIILGDTEIEADRYEFNGIDIGFAPNPGADGTSTGNIAKPALVSSSYLATKITDDIYAGVSLNAPFGLVTEPENRDWAGSLLSRTSDIFNIVGTPTIGVKIAPGVSLAAGVQIGYLEGTLKFGSAGAGNVFYNGDDFGLGWTLGATVEPAAGTRIGLGYRSEIEYELEGVFGENIAGLPNAFASPRIAADVELTTPDIFTISLNQAVTQDLRVYATYEWTQWSDFSQLNINATEGAQGSVLAPGVPIQAGDTIATLNADWDDAWFASIGAEYDYSDRLTLRAGVAYEQSPIQEATQRLTAVPDNDRTWLSFGLSYEAGKILPGILGEPGDTTIDFAYTHIIVEDGEIERELISDPDITLFADSEDASVDIISFALRTKFGHEPAPFK